MSRVIWRRSIASFLLLVPMPHESEMTPQPGLVSVIIPSYNAKRFLAETLDSALAQTTYPKTEIIVVDDGSTDGTVDLIRTYFGRVKAEFGPNRGASAARNKGTALASGEFIQYLDADDLLAPNAIEKRLLALLETGADVAYSDWQRFEAGPDGSRLLGEIASRRLEDVNACAEIACATSFWAPPAALLYRRRIVDAIGSWNERLPIIQDARFLFDAARHGASFVHVPGVTAYYRHANTSLSRGNQQKFVLDVYRNAIEIQSAWESDGPLTEARKSALAGIFDYAARELFRCDMSEFADAAARYKSLSSRRIGYVPAAHLLSSIMGHQLAYRLLGLTCRMRSHAASIVVPKYL